MTSSSRDTHDAERRLIELSDLLEISQTLNQSLELEAILNHLLLASMGRFAVGRGMFLLAVGPSRFRVAVSKGLADIAPGLELDIECPPAQPIDLAEAGDGFELFVERRLGVIIPLARAGSCVGLLALGRKLTGRPFEPAELEFLTSLASVASPAIENSRVHGELQHLNMQLDRKIHELNTLFEIGRRFVGTLDADEVLKLFSYALMGQLLLARYAIILRRPAGEIVHTRGLALGEGGSWRDEAFWELVSSLDEPLRIDAAAHGPLAERGLAAIVPIRKEGVTHGFVGLGERPSGQQFTADELAFAAALANQAVISLENAWLIEETIEKRRLEEELAIAKSIQNRLFPKVIPTIEGYELSARSTPTRHVGGDYYDTIDLGEAGVLLAIADVSGKGVPAALLMSNVQATLRALAAPGMDLAACAARINEIIYANTDFNKYATFFYGILEPTSGRFTFTNAGHNPPMLLRPSGSLDLLEAGGLPVGLMPGGIYEWASVEIGPGDLLVLYTDGVTEAESAGGEEYGTDRLEQLVRDLASGTADALLCRIADDVTAFSTGMPQADDITMMVLKRA